MTERLLGEASRIPQVWSTQAYMEAFIGGQRIELPADCGLRGRVMRGRDDADFEHIGTGDRDIAFIMGPDGLSGLPGVPLRSALHAIGLTPEYVEGRIKQGFSYRLLVFQGADTAPLATWDNVLDMVAKCRPALARDIAAHRETLKVTPFEVFAGRMLESFDAIDLAGPQHQRYMDTERYLQIPLNKRLADAFYLRRWLLHVEHLGPLYAGDAYTLTSEGERGLAEYAVLNGPVAGLVEPMMADLVL